MMQFKPLRFSMEEIRLIEKKYKCKYILDSEIKLKYGWSNDAWAIFYCDEVHPKSRSRYMAAIPSDTAGSMILADGKTVAEVEISGVLFPDGYFLYSRFRHDFRSHGRISVDGGREYFRLIGPIGDSGGIPTNIKIVDGNVEIS